MGNLFKTLILLLLGLLLGQSIVSCNEQVCNLPNGYKTSDLLARVAREKKYNYCDLLDAALKGNDDSIRKLALMDFSEAAGYDHGAVLIEVVLKVGDRKFINSIKSISEQERTLIEGYLNVGLEYGYRKEYENSKLKEVFPHLYSFLHNNYSPSHTILIHEKNIHSIPGATVLLSIYQ